MNHVELLSLNISKPVQMKFNNKEVSTGIFKTPVNDSLFLSWENFEGDGQADLVHHGGREKAVCVYAYEHYPFWEKELGTQLGFGAFGENLTVRGLVETDVCIGDVFKLGEAIVQVSQPRQPCFKLSIRYQAPEMPLKVQETGYTGFYFRVLKEGRVSLTDSLVRVASHPKSITISFANRIMHVEKDSMEDVKRILEVEELSVNWRRTFTKRLMGNETDSRERLTGSH
ncbi:6-N-hydroxylaminopurine resistance protein [compost metagenome]